MIVDRQYYSFYRSYLNKICQNIKAGKVLILVGINSIGKTLLTMQLQSDLFQKKYLNGENAKLVFLEFKDKNPPNPTQLYKYWLTQTAKTLNCSLPQDLEFNDFSFYFHLSEMARRLKAEEKLVFVVLDAQNILNQGEAFYKALVYLHRYTYRQVSNIFLSEPQILDCKNIWAHRFIQDCTNYKFTFLKLFDLKTIETDIQREESFLKAKLPPKQHSLILKYSGGLHGIIGALAYFLKQNPKMTDIRQLTKIVFNDKMYQYWIEDILHSLPTQTLRILKQVISNRSELNKYKNDISGKWLIDLGFVKNNGVFRHPLMLPIVKEYKEMKGVEENELRYSNSQFYFHKEKIKLTKREKLTLEILYKSRNKLVTYDTISEILWKDNPDDFSLWAISQIVRRLRKKLSFYSINPKIISSVRGEGYTLN